MITCPTPYKTGRYSSRDAAEMVARKAKDKNGVDLYAYLCVCTWWHLTRSPQEDPLDASMATDSDLQYLRTTPDDVFREVVAQDARGQGERGRRAALRHHSLLVRWRRTLGVLVNELNHRIRQGPGNRSLVDYDWNRRATEYRNNLMVRLDECKRFQAEDMGRDATVSERRRRDAEVAALSGATRKELRARAGEAAIQRLIEEHGPEFNAYLAQEYTALGLSLPDRIHRRLDQE